jgi:hypothetical protein
MVCLFRFPLPLPFVAARHWLRHAYQVTSGANGHPAPAEPAELGETLFPALLLVRSCLFPALLPGRQCLLLPCPGCRCFAFCGDTRLVPLPHVRGVAFAAVARPAVAHRRSGPERFDRPPVLAFRAPLFSGGDPVQHPLMACCGAGSDRGPHIGAWLVAAWHQPIPFNAARIAPGGLSLVPLHGQAGSWWKPSGVQMPPEQQDGSSTGLGLAAWARSSLTWRRRMPWRSLARDSRSFTRRHGRQ